MLVAPVQDTWPQSAALVDALDGDGIDVNVTRRWVFMYDPRMAPDGREQVVLRVVPPGTAASGSGLDTVVASGSATVLATDRRG